MILPLYKRKYCAVFFVFLCIFIYCEIAKADTVYINTGDIIHGDILGYNNSRCIFKIKYSNIDITIRSSDIIGLSTSNKYMITFTNNDTVTGKLQYTNKTLSLRSPLFGNTPVDIKNIVSIERIEDTVKRSTVAAAEKNSPSAKSPDAGSGQEKQKTAKQEYGEKEKEPPVEFLTGNSVLLDPGEWELIWGARYRRVKSSFSLMEQNSFETSALTARRLDFFGELRYGLFKDIEVWIDVPFSYAYIEDVSGNEWVRSQGEFNLADISFGLQYQILREDTYPGISISLAGTAPTGKKTYRKAEEEWLQMLDNGNGHWGVGAGVHFVRTVSPAVLFGGVSYEYFFPAYIDGWRTQPGAAYTGYFGMGFALNDDLSASSRLSYSYNRNMKFDGKTFEGSGTEPLDLSFSLAYRTIGDIMIMPEVVLGMNDDAGQPGLGITFSKKF